MIKESLKVYGNTQFEIKQKVAFEPDSKEVDYNVETYFFIPNALQINPYTYSGDEFKRGLKNYVRLRSPQRKFSRMGKEEIVKLKETLVRLSTQESVSIQEYENTLKYFSLAYKSSLRLATKMVIRKKQTPEYVEDLVLDIKRTLNAYRKLKSLAAQIESKMSSDAFAYCDEFMSVATSFYLVMLLKQAGIPLRETIVQLGRDVLAYRKKHYPDTIPSTTGDNEQVIYRWEALKKYVNAVLFLDVMNKKGSPLLLHSIYGIAAATSMIFATIIAFFWQGKYGALSTNLFLALVVGYIFKDRIKDIMRAYLFRIFQKWIPDRRLMIYKDRSTIVGFCNESFRFHDSNLLPEQIKEMRRKAHSITLLNDHRPENIFFYKKEVHLHNQPKLFEQTKYSISDITRFDVTDFLKHVDNMFEEFPLMEDDEQTTIGNKVYHIYLIRRITSKQQTASELVRLVINANGIKRLEVIQPLKFMPTTKTAVK